MRFNIMIDGKQVPARYTGKTARLYREQFRKDIFETLADISASKIKGLQLVFFII